MSKIIHDKFGAGTIIHREEKSGGSYLAVRFDESGKEMRLAIPASFENGHFTVEGDLKAEIEAAVSAKNALAEEKKKASLAGIKPPAMPRKKRISSKTKSSHPAGAGHSPAPYTTGGTIEGDFERHLISEGYKTVTPSGAKSTVYTYIDAIKNNVLEGESISWSALKGDISRIVALYGEGGAKERIGSKSNNTVICALRCFESFVNP